MSGEPSSTSTPTVKIDPSKPIQPLFQISPTLEENRSSELRPVFISLGLDRSAFKDFGGEPDRSQNRFAAPKAVFDTALRGTGRWSDRIWLFKGDSFLRYFEKKDAHDEVDGPITITQSWSGWPANFATGIDASLQGTADYEGKAWFFKGNQYLRYDLASDKVELAPRPIAGNWLRMPDNFAQGIDAAVHGLGPYYGICWFFKGNQYVRYNLQRNKEGVEGGPRPIAGPWGGDKWPATFTSIDFAFYGTGSDAEKLYFFHGDQYILYNVGSDTVEEGPKPIIDNWQRLAPSLPQPQLFLVEKYELRTFRGDVGPGDQIGSVNVAPHGKPTVHIATKRSTTTTSESTTSILESQSQQTADTFSDAIKDDQSRSGSAEKYDYQLDASFHGEAGATLTGGEADAKLNVRGGSQDVRNEFAKSVGRQIGKQATATNETHKNSVREVKDSTTINTETETVFEQMIDNTANSEPINCAILQLVQEYIVVLSMIDAQLAFRNGNPRQSKTVSISNMKSLLEETLIQPEAQARVAAVVADSLQNVTGVDNKIHSLIARISPEATDTTHYRIDTAVTSTYEVKDSAGNLARSIVVPGVILHVDRPVVLTPNTAFVPMHIP
jgi:hypothetical protein